MSRWEAPLDVSIEAYYVGHEGSRQVEAVLAEYGFPARVRQTIAFSPTEPGGPLFAMTIILVPLTAFLSAFAAEFGKDAYRKLKECVQKLNEKRAFPPGRVVIKDGLSVSLHPDLPDEAYQQLFTTDLSQHADGTVLYWDAHEAEWLGRPRRRVVIRAEQENSSS